ncbi:hypothetical protein ACIQFZ_31080 [Streptomyces sp. NPDC093064]|uniref:hypothetical protein n=1 Tax=Streptomyces sp. NPDC093064 TaxID=3366020 RepID=UPI00380CA5BC
MSAQPQGDPRRAPGSSSPRAPSATSPYAGALGPRKNLVELPVGHTAEVRPPVTAGDFIGKYFAQDSLEFLRCAWHGWLTEPELRSALLEWHFTPDSHEAFSRYLAFRSAQS